MFSCSIENILKKFFIFCLLSFVLITCEKQTTPIETTNISLIAEYVGVTEAELLLVTDLEELPDQYQLLRNGEAVISGELTDSHTTLWDTTLQPAQTYTYQVKLLQQNVTQLQSNELTLTTMDTTSHDFQWEIIEIPSPYGSGVLRDVAIINENDIWAVGEIYADSAQPSKRFNAVHWDGSHWELKRVPYVYNGQSYYHPLNFAFSFENGEIWFGGNGIVKWNGNSFSNVEIDPNVWGPVAINKMWGSYPDNIFIVGDGGSIAHFNGNSWQKLESGTDLPITDIWGATNPQTDGSFILCTAAEKFSGRHSKIFRIKTDNSILELPWPFTDRDSYSVWFKNSYPIFICGDGVFKLNRLNIYHVYNTLPQFFTNRIRGNEINDIYIAGAFGLMAHCNGIQWWIHPGFISGTFKSLAVKEDLAVAVGEKNHNAYITKLFRN
jgi:hypothetical protein